MPPVPTRTRTAKTGEVDAFADDRHAVLQHTDDLAGLVGLAVVHLAKGREDFLGEE